jgi:hypothetical protein
MKKILIALAVCFLVIIGLGVFGAIDMAYAVAGALGTVALFGAIAFLDLRADHPNIRPPNFTDPRR